MWLSYRNTTCGWDGVTRSLAEFKISFELTRNATWNEKRQWLSLFRNRRIMWNIMITKGYGMVRLHGCATAFSSHSAPARSLSQRDHINSGRLEKLSKHRNPFESTNPNHQNSKNHELLICLNHCPHRSLLRGVGCWYPALYVLLQSFTNLTLELRIIYF